MATPECSYGRGCGHGSISFQGPCSVVRTSCCPAHNRTLQTPETRAPEGTGNGHRLTCLLPFQGRKEEHSLSEGGRGEEALRSERERQC